MTKTEINTLDIEIFKDYYIIYYECVLFYIKNAHFKSLLQRFNLDKLNKAHLMMYSEFAIDTYGIIKVSRNSKSSIDFEKYIVKNHKHDNVWDILTTIEIEELLALQSI